MRSIDISYTVNETTRTGVLEYPDLWCFTFNPNYLIISMDDETLNGQITVTISTASKSYDVYVNLYKGKAKRIYLQSAQLLIDDVEHHRTAVVTVRLTDGEVDMLMTQISCIAVWGGIQMGEQFGKYGAFISNGKDHSHVRNVVWFRNFPFYVSMFRAEPGELSSFECDHVDPEEGSRDSIAAISTT